MNVASSLAKPCNWKTNLDETVLLHITVTGPTAALGSYPGDVLAGILDIAGLAVDTVLGVYLEALV